MLRRRPKAVPLGDGLRRRRVKTNNVVYAGGFVDYNKVRKMSRDFFLIFKDDCERCCEKCDKFAEEAQEIIQSAFVRGYQLCEAEMLKQHEQQSPST